MLDVIERQMEGHAGEGMWWVGERWKLYLFLCQGGSFRISLGEDDNELNLGKMEHLPLLNSLQLLTDLGPL